MTTESNVPPPPPGAAGEAGAGAGRRAAARLLDAVLVGVPASIVLAVLGLPAQTIGLGGLDAWVPSALTAAAWFAYHALTEGLVGTTLGKRLLRCRVVDDTGGPPGVRAAATRNLWLGLGLIPFVGGLAWLAAIVVILGSVSRSSDGRGVHDRLAGTAVAAHLTPYPA